MKILVKYELVLYMKKMFYQKTLRNVPLISDPFIKAHLFETIVFLQKEIGFHYTEVSYTR